MKPLRSLAQLTLLVVFLVLTTTFARALYVGEAVLAPDEAVGGASLLHALDEVLVRLTGRVDDSPVAMLGLTAADARALTQSQQRVRVERLDARGARVEELRLRAEFYPPAVDELLARQQLPRLGRQRPAILLWVALDDDEGPRLADAAMLEHELAEQSRRFGLDVVLPLGDAMDMALVQVADIRGGFIDVAEAGADRYGAGVVAMADLREDDEGWNGRWLWRIEGRDLGLQVQGYSALELIEPGLRAMLASLAERYATLSLSGDSSRRRVQVAGIVDAVQYAEVLRLFDQLGPVASYRVLAASGREISFDVELASDGLEDAIALSRVLVIEHRAADGTLHLRLGR